MYVESNFFSGKSLSLGVLMYRKSTEISIQKLKSKIHFNENYLGTIYTSRNEANYIGRHIHFKSSHNKWLKIFCPSTYFVFVKRNKLAFSFRKYNLLWKKTFSDVHTQFVRYALHLLQSVLFFRFLRCFAIANLYNCVQPNEWQNKSSYQRKSWWKKIGTT